MRLVFIFGYFQAGCWHSTRLAVPEAAGCLLPGSAGWLCPYYGLVQWGDTLTGTVIIKLLGGKPACSAELESYETNVSEVRQYSGDGEQAGRECEGEMLWGFCAHICHILNLIHRMGCSPKWSWRQVFIRTWLQKANGSGLLWGQWGERVS